jgi:anti-sigma regulatory factor (Ser/Thr protein kinase)
VVVDSGAELMETWFSTEARSAGNARHAVRRCLRTTDLRRVEEVELLTSELFAQAAQAAHDVGRVCIRVRQAGNRVHVEVAHETADEARTLVARDPLEAAILDRLLDAFSVRWGRYTSAQGEGATWFETSLAH